MMLSWIDILIVVVIIGFSIEGAIKGFVRGVLSLFTLIASIIIAHLFSGEIGEWIATITPIGDNIREKLALEVAPEIVGSGSVESWLTTNNLNHVPDLIISFLNNFWNNATQFGEDFVDIFADKATQIIMNMIAFVIILIVCFILLTILVAILDTATKLPIIDTFNKVGGLLFGLGKGLLISVVIVSILFAVALYFMNENITIAMSSSVLAQYFYIGHLLF